MLTRRGVLREANVAEAGRSEFATSSVIQICHYPFWHRRSFPVNRALSNTGSTQFKNSTRLQSNRICLISFHGVEDTENARTALQVYK
ncbi:hypothetical protein M3J09_006403 [Ascochyta lentis]